MINIVLHLSIGDINFLLLLNDPNSYKHTHMLEQCSSLELSM